MFDQEQEKGVGVLLLSASRGHCGLLNKPNQMVFICEKVCSRNAVFCLCARAALLRKLNEEPKLYLFICMFFSQIKHKFHLMLPSLNIY